jgi:uncharacterized membrane protein
MREWDGVGGAGDRPGDGRRRGGFTLWAARHPILVALLMSGILVLPIAGRIVLHTLEPGRPPHTSPRRLWIVAGAMWLVLFVAFAGMTLAVARGRKRSGTALTAEGLGLPFKEDRDAAAHRPPALLVLRPSMRTVTGLVTMLPLLVGVLSLVAAVVKSDTGHSGVALWFGLAFAWLAAGVWARTGHRRQRIIVDSDDVYVYTFTGRYYRTERSRIAELRRTQNEPILADAEGARLVRLPFLTGAQRGELAQVLQVPVRERERAEHSTRRGAAGSRR